MTADHTVLTIDLNADLGEGAGQDAEILPLVSSVNISCGAHAGDHLDIVSALEQAAQREVAVGAHPSYPDREFLGRRSVAMPPARLRATILAQLESLAERAIHSGTRLQHVKPHGALYNDAASDMDLAQQLCEIVAEFDRDIVIVGLAGGRLLEAAQHLGLPSRSEAFVDRRYQADGTLVNRSHPAALLTRQEQAVAQALSIIQSGQVTTIDGTSRDLNAQTLCIHGDTPGALLFARQLRAALDVAGIQVGAPPRSSLPHSPTSIPPSPSKLR